MNAICSYCDAPFEDACRNHKPRVVDTFRPSIDSDRRALALLREGLSRREIARRGDIADLRTIDTMIARAVADEARHGND